MSLERFVLCIQELKRAQQALDLERKAEEESCNDFQFGLGRCRGEHK